MEKLTLSDYVEEISDDFGSTFSTVDNNTLANMLSPNDFRAVTDIIGKYMPHGEVTFNPTHQMSGDCDIYLISVEKLEDRF